jgi:hypothetical protein
MMNDEHDGLTPGHQLIYDMLWLIGLTVLIVSLIWFLAVINFATANSTLLQEGAARLVPGETKPVWELCTCFKED